MSWHSLRSVCAGEEKWMVQGPRGSRGSEVVYFRIQTKQQIRWSQGRYKEGRRLILDLWACSTCDQTTGGLPGQSTRLLRSNSCIYCQGVVNALWILITKRETSSEQEGRERLVCVNNKTILPTGSSQSAVQVNIVFEPAAIQGVRFLAGKQQFVPEVTDPPTQPETDRTSGKPTRERERKKIAAHARVFALACDYSCGVVWFFRVRRNRGNGESTNCLSPGSKGRKKKMKRQRKHKGWIWISACLCREPVYPLCSRCFSRCLFLSCS